MRSARLVVCLVLVLGAAAAANAATFKVRPAGQTKPGEFDSIQAAVDAASAGDKVVVFPGDYTEPDNGTSAAVRITKSLKLLAKSKLKKDPPVKVRILPGPGQTDGILVAPEVDPGPVIDKIMIKGFTVEGFTGNGIELRHTSRFKIIGNESINNLHNGIFPTLSANGLVKKNLSYGSQDSALWVEASDSVKVIKNELHSAPTGLEITVSTNVLAKKNDIHDNTVGVGLYHANGASLDPGPDDGDYRIEKNRIYNNNAANTASPGSFPAALPPGIGILSIGVNRVDIKNNTVDGNDLAGVVVMDWCFATDLALPGSGVDCPSSPPVVPSTPNYNEVTKNELTNNGSNPPPGFEAFGKDVLFFPGFEGVNGVGNCFEDNTPANYTFLGSPRPPCL